MELRRVFKTSKDISFYGHYTVLVDPLMNEQERVKMTALKSGRLLDTDLSEFDHLE
jgi:hypothetical protein